MERQPLLTPTAYKPGIADYALATIGGALIGGLFAAFLLRSTIFSFGGPSDRGEVLLFKGVMALAAIRCAIYAKRTTEKKSALYAVFEVLLVMMLFMTGAPLLLMGIAMLFGAL